MRLLIFLITMIPAIVEAHDTWVETNTNLIRAGDAVSIDLKLGNHGNEHRDFKLASKIALGDDCTLTVTAPDGSEYDLRDRLIDVGYTPTEGYWTARFSVRDPGLYVVTHTLDRVVNHGRPVRSIKSARTCFVAANSLDRVPREHTGFARMRGQGLELVPVVNPVTPMGPGQPISIQLLLDGEPLPGERVAFIPRGITLAEGFDAEYERRTDAGGRASFTPRFGQTYLVAAHHHSDESGEDYEATSYSATLTVLVPDLCPCCAE